MRIANRVNEEVCLGSGTLVGREGQVGTVLSCAHLFSEGVGEICIAFPRGPAQRALVIAVDKANDLAVLAVRQPAGPVIPIARTRPREDAPLASLGYGQDGKLKVNRGRHLGYVTLRDGADSGVLELAGAARQGDSGGPVIDAEGYLVAVIMGTDGATVDGTHCDLVRSFLDRNRLTTAIKDRVTRLPAVSAKDEPLLSIDARVSRLAPSDHPSAAQLQRGAARSVTPVEGE